MSSSGCHRSPRTTARAVRAGRRALAQSAASAPLRAGGHAARHGRVPASACVRRHVPGGAGLSYKVRYHVRL
ncbi:hypothetical protein TVNIR_1829 [Thioalkalivibrio nitratireducens DSM 14787]|uniref:Uncharacterized protein n=1 Tax=Thioalkalivibrio nitratireducens (strain DSM 14787 / UNIQEM 213 / ALEN2) TaxID=1255043 RepID=L0DX03_THIND|nr:hypothetical protein TVNIR_1829 [Thioalkalivibrio nitratireducens DSM 14787]